MSASAKNKRPKWHLIYYALAAFDILTVSGSLYLGHEGNHIFRQSADINIEWAEVRSSFAELGQLASVVNAPGNDVFDSQDSDKEMKRRDVALATFNKRIGKLREQIQNLPEASNSGTLDNSLDDIITAMKSMDDEANLIFRFIRDKEIEQAGQRMATMERKYADVTNSVAKAEQHVQMYQLENFGNQLTEATSLKRFEYLIAGLILLMVVCVTWYGHRLAKQMRITEEQRKSDLHELKRKEEDIQSRVFDLQDAHERIEEGACKQLALSEDLALARDAAEAANQTKSEFLATVSHEVRTPMNGIQSMIDLLSQTELTNEQATYARAAQDSAATLLTIINDILDYSKLEAGRLEVENISFDVEQLAESVHSLMGARAADKNLKLNLELDDNLPCWVRGDPTRVRQVLYNLVGNAIKFTEGGEVRVAVAQKDLSSNKVEIHYSVTDTGIGISDKAQKKLFTRFYQADSSITRRFGGTGLGLAICKQLVELMGGQIGVESTLGEGSRFWFKIPCDPGVQPSHSAQDLPATTHDIIRSVGRILVAEDNRINQLLIRTLLEKAGLTPDIVENGRQAVEAVKATAYDVVLMDVHMSELDGLRAAQKIRGLSGPARQVPIIALTAHAMASNRDAYLAYGMDDYVSKPIDPPSLFQAIARVMQSKLQQQGALQDTSPIPRTADGKKGNRLAATSSRTSTSRHQPLAASSD